MTVKSVGSKEPRIVSTTPTEPRVVPSEVARVLGAEVRAPLRERLASSGGRPALAATTRLLKVPLSEATWQRLREVTAAVVGENFHPTPGQVASVLLERALASQQDAIWASIRVGQQSALRQAREQIERDGGR